MSNVRKIIKNNRGSYYVNIPKEIVSKIRFKDGQKVEIDKKGKTVIIKDWKK